MPESQPSLSEDPQISVIVMAAPPAIQLLQVLCSLSPHPTGRCAGPELGEGLHAAAGSQPELEEPGAAAGPCTPVLPPPGTACVQNQTQLPKLQQWWLGPSPPPGSGCHLPLVYESSVLLGKAEQEEKVGGPLPGR